MHPERQLSWAPQRQSPHKQPSIYTSPTWPWASLNGLVYFPNNWIERGDLTESTIVGRVLGVKCSPTGLDPTGTISSGHVTVTGQAIQAKLFVSANDSLEGNPPAAPPAPSGHPYRYRIKNETLGSEHCFVTDCAEDIDMSKEEHTVTLLLWDINDRAPAYKKASIESPVTCLVLVPAEGKQNM